MKRSSMVSLINKYLESESETRTKRDLADYLVETIERLGMLPPTRVRHPIDKDWPEDAYPVPFESNSWEPEDETK